MWSFKTVSVPASRYTGMLTVQKDWPRTERGTTNKHLFIAPLFSHAPYLSKIQVNQRDQNILMCGFRFTFVNKKKVLDSFTVEQYLKKIFIGIVKEIKIKKKLPFLNVPQVKKIIHCVLPNSDTSVDTAVMSEKVFRMSSTNSCTVCVTLAMASLCGHH